jgi:hypothetical protein
MSPRPLVKIIAVLAFGLAGCGAEDRNTADATRPVAAVPGGLVAGDPIPSPKGKVLLRVAGVQAANRKGSIAAFDMKTLERLPRVDATVTEPFLKKQMRFSGIRVADLLRITGAPNGKVTMHALDDYKVTFSAGQLADTRAVLATRANGKRITLAKGGPIRIILLGDSEDAHNTDNWIWSVDSMKVPAT